MKIIKIFEIEATNIVKPCEITPETSKGLNYHTNVNELFAFYALMIMCHVVLYMLLCWMFKTPKKTFKENEWNAKTSFVENYYLHGITKF